MGLSGEIGLKYTLLSLCLNASRLSRPGSPSIARRHTCCLDGFQCMGDADLCVPPSVVLDHLDGTLIHHLDGELAVAELSQEVPIGG